MQSRCIHYNMVSLLEVKKTHDHHDIELCLRGIDIMLVVVYVCMEKKLKLMSFFIFLFHSDRHVIIHSIEFFIVNTKNSP